MSARMNAVNLAKLRDWLDSGDPEREKRTLRLRRQDGEWEVELRYRGNNGGVKIRVFGYGPTVAKAFNHAEELLLERVEELGDLK